MDWIAECDRIDHWLHDQGVPDDVRMKAMAEIATVMVKAKRRADAREREAQALALAARGMAVVAERQGCTRMTAYRRSARAVTRLRNSVTNKA